MPSVLQNSSEDLTLSDLRLEDELVVNKAFGGLPGDPTFQVGDIVKVVRLEPEQDRIVVQNFNGVKLFIHVPDLEARCVSRQ
jgi:hypothetical protein